jgi:type I restriction enzyme S subunit
MNAERLLAHYERIADAPDAIARLRRFVLDLAVRGKLVPQDATDEPASELLKRIAAEKARLVKAAEIRTPKAIPALPEIPFPIPSNWRWSQLAEIGVLSPRNEAPDTLEASFVPMPLIAAEYGVANQHEIRPWGEIKKGYTHFAEGDVGLAKITPCFENGKSAVFRNLTGGIGAGTTELHVVRPLFVDQDYILLFLKSPHFIETGIPRMTGTAGQKRVPTEYFTHSPFPLPPLAEQHRIVAKVDELMALCDRLEAARQTREASRDKLTAASLARLNAPDPDTFPDDARFALDALPALTARADQIKQLRQTILNIAVRGKLVPQDPNDEPASDVDLKIKNRSRGQIQESIEPPFGLPVGWAWRAIDTLADQVTDGEHATPPRISETQVPLVTAKNVREGFMDYSQTDWVSFETAKKAWGRCRPQVGDLLLVCVGATTGRLTVLREPRDMVLVRSVALIRPNSDVLNEYLERAIRSPLVQQQIWASVKAAAQPCLYINRIQSLLIPLPPLAEQHRIVAKVDALMALCDRLEASLTATAATRRRLLDALLAEALASDEKRELEAAE